MRIFGQEFKRQIPGIDDVAPIDVGGMFPVLKGGCIMGWAFTVVYPGNLRQRLTPKLTRNPESLGYKSRDIILHSSLIWNFESAKAKEGFCVISKTSLRAKIFHVT